MKKRRSRRRRRRRSRKRRGGNNLPLSISASPAVRKALENIEDRLYALERAIIPRAPDTPDTRRSTMAIFGDASPSAIRRQPYATPPRKKKGGRRTRKQRGGFCAACLAPLMLL